jgi:uncharacterized iron-regulated membrane protein
VGKLFQKDTLFKIHGWVGIKLSILLFIVCFSGTLAVFSHEMDWLFNPAMRATPSETFASRNLAVQNIHALFPEGQITYWERSREPYLTDIAYVKYPNGFEYVLVNPYTGVVQGSVEVTVQRFFRDLHYFLFIPNQVGNYLVLFFGLVLVVSLITGMLYYKDWYKRLFVLKTGHGSQAFYSSLHKLMGAWSIPFMILIGGTAIWYLIERSDIPKISPYLDVNVPAITVPSNNGTSTTMDLDYDRLQSIAEQAIPGLVVKDLIPPASIDKPVYITGTTAHTPLVRHRANRVYIDPNTYQVLYVQRADEINTITWLNDIADPLHFGYWGGLITKSIWFILGLMLSALTLTGPWLYLKRRNKVNTLMRERSVVHG